MEKKTGRSNKDESEVRDKERIAERFVIFVIFAGVSDLSDFLISAI